jgi:hypothetical protein
MAGTVLLNSYTNDHDVITISQPSQLSHVRTSTLFNIYPHRYSLGRLLTDWDLDLIEHSSQLSGCFGHFLRHGKVMTASHPLCLQLMSLAAVSQILATLVNM